MICDTFEKPTIAPSSTRQAMNGAKSPCAVRAR